MLLKDMLRGVSDTFRNLPFALIYSLSWWAALLLILPAPGATIALFRLTDPRIVRTDDRPNRREVLDVVRFYLWPGWQLTLVIGSVVLVAVWNLASFGRHISNLTVLAPLWIAIWLVGSILGTLSACSMGLFGDSLRAALIRATGILFQRPLAAPALLFIVVLVLLAGAALVLPLFLFVPAMIAAIVNRFVLRASELAVPDPLEPTPERAAEEQRDRASRAFGP